MRSTVSVIALLLLPALVHADDPASRRVKVALALSSGECPKAKKVKEALQLAAPKSKERKVREALQPISTAPMPRAKSAPCDACDPCECRKCDCLSYHDVLTRIRKGERLECEFKKGDRTLPDEVKPGKYRCWRDASGVPQYQPIAPPASPSATGIPLQFVIPEQACLTGR